MPIAESELLLSVDQEVRIAASPERVFEAMLEKLGPLNRTPSGDSLSMKIEPWPGGRWFRDLGDGNGHLWGHVQVIKRPTLLEICGPLFMSYAATSHVALRILANEDGSVLRLSHRTLGMVEPDHREGLAQGWGMMLEGVRDHAEGR